MRLVAAIPEPAGEVRRVMVYDAGEGGVYLFLYRSPDDGPCSADEWYESVAGAVGRAEGDYGVRPADWRSVPDPRPGCQHDWIVPMRVRRGPDGRPLWGQYEPATD